MDLAPCVRNLPVRHKRSVKIVPIACLRHRTPLLIEIYAAVLHRLGSDDSMPGPYTLVFLIYFRAATSQMDMISSL